MKTLIRGGTIYSRGEAAPGDVLIEDDTIAAVGDCRGLDGRRPRRRSRRLPRAAGAHRPPRPHRRHDRPLPPGGHLGRARSRTAAAAGITTLGGFITQKPDEPLAAAIERAAEPRRRPLLLRLPLAPDADPLRRRRLDGDPAAPGVGLADLQILHDLPRERPLHVLRASGRDRRAPLAGRRAPAGPRRGRGRPGPSAGLRPATDRFARRTMPGCGRPRPSCGRSSAWPKSRRRPGLGSTSSTSRRPEAAEAIGRAARPGAPHLRDRAALSFSRRFLAAAARRPPLALHAAAPRRGPRRPPARDGPRRAPSTTYATDHCAFTHRGQGPRPG